MAIFGLKMAKKWYVMVKITYFFGPTYMPILAEYPDNVAWLTLQN